MYVVVLLAAVYGLFNAIRQTHHRQELLDALTDQQQADLALNESRDYGRAILDENAKVIEWNPALERWTGYSKEEMLGHSLDALMSEDAAARHKRAFQAAMDDPVSRKQVQVVECQIIPKDPTAKPIEVRVSVRVVRSPDSKRKPYAVAHIDRRQSIVEVRE